MSISSPGIGSGLDVNGIISKLMRVESQPLNDFDTKEASYQAEISALGSLKGSLSALQNAASAFVPAIGQAATDKFASYSASLADPTVGTATVSAGAVAGSYNLQVASVAKSDQIGSAAYANSTAAVGTGTIVIERGTVAGGIGSGGAFTDKTGTSPVTVTIDATNNTLAGISAAINNAKAGVTATIVSGTGGAYLMLTSDNTGTQDELKITSSLVDTNNHPLQDLNYNPATNTGSMTQTQAPTDAALTINSIPVTSNSNTISNAVTGVTLTLNGNATLPANTTLTVGKDTASSLTAAFNALAKAYNDFSKTAHNLGSYDSAGKKAGPLLGDATLLTAQTQIERVLGDIPAGASGTYQRLAQVGVTLQKDGTMAVDATQLQTAINTDYSSVAALASAFGTALGSAANMLAGSGGSLDAATSGLNASIKAIDNRRQEFQQMLGDTEARYRREFSALDATIGAMNSTSSYLQQQLASLSQMNTPTNVSG